MKQLDLVFNVAGSKTKSHFRLQYANTALDKAAVQKAMDDIAALSIFVNKEGAPLYDTPVSAKYVESVETPIIEEAE
ncbi:DUF2922 domain-containing protein [Liquorilactobacillus oeni]|uniref:DUF2922 domain-containing protein n=1 Tax=Liquorilactobacillus oeni DSM 19972 TaxID=1423777 RepID=A0A0R1M8L1_9LACO|nr:DUF2922 domain-containing protein [Liquorilactobacillus oeni]KRL04495.1 hypothetical protein FD46_GL001626 [Liquorilactobacillus oeni DSM 19972]